MKKLTLLTLACSMTILSFAAGGNITYELNGGVTNDFGWKNKADMLVGLNQDYNTFYKVTTGTWLTWETLDVILATADPVTRIPTFAAKMWEVIKTDKWLWLHDYIVATGASQGIAAIAESENAFWRYEVSAFFTSRKRAGWPISADYTVAGQPDAFIPAWKHAFTGPATYDGTTEVIIPNPFKEGFTFDGWYDNAGFTGNKITSIAAGTEGDKTLYAKWIEYIPTCAEVKAFAAGTTTKAGGSVSLVLGSTVYMQDATGGMMVEFTEAPTVAAGNKITVTGTTAAVGTYIKVTGATLASKETGTAPTHQTLALAVLKTDFESYLFEYVYLEGLKVASYGAGNVVLADDAENTITLNVGLNQSTIPVNTKVNVKAVVTYDTEFKLITEASKVTISPVPRPDQQTYTELEEGKYSLTSKWMVSMKLDNLSANPIGTSGFVRGMTAKDGKMYFIDREHKQITVVDGATGNKLAPISLAANIFMHDFKNISGNDSVIAVAGTLPYNDIKIDNAGNVLLGNCITSNAQPFQVWKIDLATGNGVLIIDEILKKNRDFATAPIRFDAFGVYGDVDGNAIIMAANASAMEAYKWEITNGVAGAGEVVIIDTDIEGTFITKYATPGTAPQIFPMDENYFYLDGNATLPTLIDMGGQVVDGFFNFPKEVEDWAPRAGDGLSGSGHNGLIEFEMGGEHFFLMAYMNTAGSPASSFRLFKWANANKEFKDIQSMWILPANGMGATSNPYRTAVPSVEVDEVNKIATIYLYTGENGYGVYEFKINAGNDVKNVNDNKIVKITVNERTLNFDKQVAHVAVYSIAGQLQVKAKNVNFVNVANNGVYLVKATNLEGETVVHKVVVE